MTEWPMSQQIAHPARTAVVTGLLMPIVVVAVDVIDEGGFRPSVAVLVIGGFARARRRSA
ncbi:hypothetical protein KIPE111705_33185 [Kibdelosporangium persicum]